MMRRASTSSLVIAFLATPTALGSTSLFGSAVPRLCAARPPSPSHPHRRAMATISPPPATDAAPTTAEPRVPSALGHEMEFTPVTGMRRLARGWRLLRQIRGRLERGTILTLRIGGEVPDAEPQRTLFDMATAKSKGTSLEAITDGLRLAAHDPRIGGVLIVIDPLSCGWARVLEIRRHLQYFAAAGKQVTVFMEQGGPKEFFLGMGFDLYVPPLGNLNLMGFTVSATFVRGVLDKVGVAPEVERIGKYKSAGDQLARTEMSDAQREMLQSILTEIDDVWVTSVSEACGVPESVVREIVERAPMRMEEYMNAGLVKGLKYLSEVRDTLTLAQQRKNENEKEDDVLERGLKTVQLRNYRRRTKEKMLGLAGPAGKKIALIRANGAITSGKSGSSPVSGQSLGSDSLVPLIRKAAEDKKIAAVVIRCDSPGGSALASDIIYEEVRRLGKKKPVVASMGDVSASGGYYLSMAAGDVVAESLTLTGSVGVVLAKLTLGNLYEKVGYSKQRLAIGKYASLFADERSFTEDEAEYWREYASVAYKSFVDKAAKSRGKSFEEMDEVAQGRVWTGRQALERGMIDHVGGLRKAIEVAKEKAGIEGDFVTVKTITEPQGLAKILGLEGNDEVAVPKTFGIDAPLVISEVGPLLDGPSPVVTFLAGAAAAAPEFSAWTDGAASGTMVGNVFGSVLIAAVKSFFGLDDEER